MSASPEKEKSRVAAGVRNNGLFAAIPANQKSLGSRIIKRSTANNLLSRKAEPKSATTAKV